MKQKLVGKASFIHSSQRRWRNLPLVSQHKLEAKLCPATAPLRVPTGATPFLSLRMQEYDLMELALILYILQSIINIGHQKVKIYIKIVYIGYVPFGCHHLKNNHGGEVVNLHQCIAPLIARLNIGPNVIPLSLLIFKT